MVWVIIEKCGKFDPDTSVGSTRPSLQTQHNSLQVTKCISSCAMGSKHTCTAVPRHRPLPYLCYNTVRYTAAPDIMRRAWIQRNVAEKCKNQDPITVIRPDRSRSLFPHIAPFSHIYLAFIVFIFRRRMAWGILSRMVFTAPKSDLRSQRY